MRTLRLPLLLLLTLFLSGLHAQQDIEDVIVEVYYISDQNDSTDDIGGFLAPGSKTYRVYIELCDSCALRSLFGDENHTLQFESTAPFFNNLDRGRIYGHQVNNSALDENTAALDSWLTLGAASNTQMGVMKEEDPDGSFVGGPNNDGGSAGISEGLLANADPEAGIPLTEQDGLMPLGGGTSVVPLNFNVMGDDPEQVLGTTTASSLFATNDFRMGSSAPGVKGPTSTNRVLVAQLTTTGDLRFALNVEVQRPNGNIARYVASDSLLQPGDTPNGLLNFPPECGCTDPNFLEYDPLAGCEDGSCATAIAFGCLDTLACNFDPTANFNVAELCCYGPGNCNGLDVQTLCPGVGIEELRDLREAIIYPNPSTGRFQLRHGNQAATRSEIIVRDLLGRIVHRQLLDASPEDHHLDLTHLPSGTYHVAAFTGRRWSYGTLVKH